MKKEQTLETLGSLWESTREAISYAEMLTNEEQRKKSIQVVKKEELKFSLNVVNNQKDEIKELLEKAGIKASVYFPFKTRTNAQGEIEFIPKNIFKMKKDSKKAREQLEEALEKNKITQDEFDLLNDNLTEMLKENGLDEEKEEDITVTEEEIEAMYETFNQGVMENMEGLIASIGQNSFYKMCEEYEDMDLDERKYRLEQFNSQINKKLGIKGNLAFSQDKNLTFENSFIKGGYMVSEKDVADKNLQDIAKSMMEKGMVRKLMTSKNHNLTAEQRKALYNKILSEKRMQERGKNLQQNNIRQRKYEVSH